MTMQHEPADALSDFSDLMAADGGYAGPSDDDRRRQRRRMRAVLLSLAIVFVLIAGAIGGYVAWALNAPLGAPTVSSQQPAVSPGSPVALVLPASGSSAISVAGGEAYLGPDASGIWATSGSNDLRPIASLSKLITALVILDAHPLASADDPGPTLTFSAADEDLYDEYYVQGATIAAMPVGSSMSLNDALATMLIPSASNYAEVVSTWAFGSQGAFLSAARTWLAENGLSSTTIVEPTGLSTQNVSTPTDMIALGKIAAANPAIARIVAMPSISLPGPGTLYNTNGLLGTAGITGLKTGNLGPDSYNLLYTATLDVGAEQPLSITGVVLGGASRESVGSAVVTLLGSIQSGFHTVPVATAGQEVGTFSTPWGASARMVVADGAEIFTWSDTPITVAMETRTPATYADGEVIGSLTWTAGPQTATAEIRIDGTIEPPTEWWRLTHPGELGG